MGFPRVLGTPVPPRAPASLPMENGHAVPSSPVRGKPPSRIGPMMRRTRASAPAEVASPALLLVLLSLGLPPQGGIGQPVSSDAFGGQPIPRFPLPSPALLLRGPARPGEYLGAVGTRAAWLGSEAGEGEIWVHPLKVLRELRLSFQIPEYPDPIPGSHLAREVTVQPGMATVTFSHGGFVVRQHVVAPRSLPGILILLEVDAVVDLRIHVEFQPVLQYAWPGGFGGQYLFWDTRHRAFILSESLRQRNAVVGSPWAVEASAHPAHRLADAPSVFVIPVDRDRARREFIPLAVAGGVASRDEVLAVYRDLLDRAPEWVREVTRWGEKLATEGLRLLPRGAPPAAEGETPAGSFSEGVIRASRALEWAKLNLAEQRVCNPDLGCGPVAGWGPSGTSFRPGFGWFFGGDAAINTLAMDVTGAWEDVAEALRFFARYQREDGKIPHEISQAAGRIPWFESYPYAYYHADTTPYWMLALWAYWRASGDETLVRELWPAFLKAYRWCRSVETDGDGIIENTTGGLGAIEVGGLGEGIHQDIYLAAVWIQALEGTAALGRALGDEVLVREADSLLRLARSSLNERYWRPAEGHHAFGILRGGGTNDNLTAWPGTALAFGLLRSEEAEGTLRHLAGEAITTPWGVRLLSTHSPLYDPLHYNNGAVWPFMTGFTAWGQYRYRRPWAGYPLLEALWRLNEDWSLGRHPENLSGAYYQTMDATVPHQFFASSMLVTPLVRGMLGWDPDAPRARAHLAPQPPPHWTGFAVENLRVGATRIRFRYLREATAAEVELEAEGPPITLEYRQPLPLGAGKIRVDASGPASPGPLQPGRHDGELPVSLNLGGSHPPVRLRFSWEGGLEVAPRDLPVLAPGSPSGGVRILDFRREGDGWLLTLEGDEGSRGEVLLRGEPVRSQAGTLKALEGLPGAYLLEVDFPAGNPRPLLEVRLRPSGRRGEEPGQGKPSPPLVAGPDLLPPSPFTEI